MTVVGRTEKNHHRQTIILSQILLSALTATINGKPSKIAIDNVFACLYVIVAVKAFSSSMPLFSAFL